MNHPNPPPKAKAIDCDKVYSLVTMNIDPARMAQFTVISGKKIPNELYNDGDTFSITISTNCTIDAITAIKSINFKKVKS